MSERHTPIELIRDTNEAQMKTIVEINYYFVVLIGIF